MKLPPTFYLCEFIVCAGLGGFHLILGIGTWPFLMFLAAIAASSYVTACEEPKT